MNGTGHVIWENIFGVDARWSARDCAMIRAMLPIQRRYTRIFSREGLEPFIEMENSSICASRWEGEGLQL
jgi:hypothetical protein